MKYERRTPSSKGAGGRKVESERHVGDPQYMRHMSPAQPRVAGINSAWGLHVCLVQSTALACGGLD